MLIRTFVYLFLAVLLSFLFYEDQLGQVVIQVSTWRLQLSLWMTLILLIGGYFVVRLLTMFLNIPQVCRRWHRHKTIESNFKYLGCALMAMIEGGSKKTTLNDLKRVHFKNGDWHVLIVLIKAVYYSSIGDIKKRELLFREVVHIDTKSHLRVSIVRGLIDYMRSDFEAVIAELGPLLQDYPDQNNLGLLLIKSHWYLKHFAWLYENREAIAKNNWLSKSELETVNAFGFEQSLQGYLQKKELSLFYSQYRQLPKSRQYTPSLVRLYVEYLKQTQKKAQISKFIHKVYQETQAVWVIDYSGQELAGDIHYRIECVLSYLQNKPDDPDLMLCLARLYRSQHHVKEALLYLQHALKQRQSKDIYIELAHVYQEMESFDQSTNCLLEALTLDN